jgi:hypothetical protein
LSAECYARALLERTKGLSRLNAFRTLAPDEALEAARKAD